MRLVTHGGRTEGKVDRIKVPAEEVFQIVLPTEKYDWLLVTIIISVRLLQHIISAGFGYKSRTNAATRRLAEGGIERERERGAGAGGAGEGGEREREIYIYIYIYIHVMYIYIYIERERERDTEKGREREKESERDRLILCVCPGHNASCVDLHPEPCIPSRAPLRLSNFEKKSAKLQIACTAGLLCELWALPRAREVAGFEWKFKGNYAWSVKYLSRPLKHKPQRPSPGPHGCFLERFSTLVSRSGGLIEQCFELRGAPECPKGDPHVELKKKSIILKPPTTCTTKLCEFTKITQDKKR